LTCASAPALRAKAPPFVHLAPLHCGEHGGDPDSVKFFHRVGLNYVSCSPFRVPVARLAAAQAAIEEKRAAKKK
jgi:phosphoenolpyruvate-protein kinase (PTS system EI component)